MYVVYLNMYVCIQYMSYTLTENMKSLNYRTDFFLQSILAPFPQRALG